jgi:hypothetical protein
MCHFKYHPPPQDRHAKKEYLKEISKLTKIVQEQCLENKKLEKLFLASKKKLLQLSLVLNQKQESTHFDPWVNFLATEVIGSYYDVARGKGFSSFGIYVDVKEFLMEVNGVVGSLFKVCESYSEAHLYLKEHFTKATDDPIFLGTDPRGPPSPPPKGGVAFPHPHPHPKRREEKRPFQGQYVGFGRAQCNGRSLGRERRQAFWLFCFRYS